MIRWRPILIGTDIAVGFLGTALLGAMLDWNNVLLPLFLVCWLMTPLTLMSKGRDRGVHLNAASGLLCWMLLAGAVEALALTLVLLLIWLIVAALVARVAT